MNDFMMVLLEASQNVLKTGMVLEILDPEFVLHIIQETLDGGHFWPMPISNHNWAFHGRPDCEAFPQGELWENAAFHSTSSHMLHQMMGAERKRQRLLATRGACGTDSNNSPTIIFSPRRPSHNCVGTTKVAVHADCIKSNCDRETEEMVVGEVVNEDPYILSSLMGALFSAVPTSTLNPKYIEKLNDLVYDAFLDNLEKACEESQAILAKADSLSNELTPLSPKGRAKEAPAGAPHALKNCSSLSSIGHASFINPDMKYDKSSVSQIDLMKDMSRKNVNLIQKSLSHWGEDGTGVTMTPSASQSLLLKVKNGIQKRRALTSDKMKDDTIFRLPSLCTPHKKMKELSRQQLNAPPKPVQNTSVLPASSRIELLRAKTYSRKPRRLEKTVTVTVTTIRGGRCKQFKAAHV